MNKDTGSRKIIPSRRVQQLSRHIVEDSACSACYGSLIYAFERLNEKGLLNKLEGKLHIGQNFKNKKYDGSIVNMEVKNADSSVCYIIGLRKDIRKKNGKQPGDTVKVTIRERIG